MVENININSSIQLKTYTLIHKNKNDNNVFDYMSSVSKNIYNSTLYCFKVYKQFENNIYEDLHKYIIKNKYVDKLKTVIDTNKKKVLPEKKIKNKDKKGNKVVKKVDNLIKLEDKLYEIYDEYYNFYGKNKKIIDNNNNIIYKYIIEDIKNNNVLITKNNITNLVNNYKLKIIKLDNISFNNNNELLVIDNIIFSIIKSCYYKTVYYIKKLIDINQEKNIDIKYTDIINSVKLSDFYTYCSIRVGLPAQRLYEPTDHLGIFVCQPHDERHSDGIKQDECNKESTDFKELLKVGNMSCGNRGINYWNHN
jgi:hypothetical protein